MLLDLHFSALYKGLGNLYFNALKYLLPATFDASTEDFN